MFLKGYGDMNWVQIASASLGALAHFYFAYMETIGWGRNFVETAAGSWIDRAAPREVAEAHIEWARKLAFNIGIYNLVLAFGLAWTAWAAEQPLAIFFSIWLLLAAVAAYHTKVYIAFYIQGCLALGLLLPWLLPLLLSAFAH